METETDFILGGSKITADGDCSHEIKRCLLLGRKAMTNLDSILKSREITNKCVSSQSYGFSSNHVWMWELDYKESCSVQSLSCVRLLVTPWITARQASLSITNSRSSLRFTSIESVMTYSQLILWGPLLLLPSIPPSIRVFYNESTLCMRWPKYWSFSFSIFLPKKSQAWSPSERTGWISLQSKGLSRVFANTIVQKHQFFGAQPSSQSNSHIHTWPQEKP